MPISHLSLVNQKLAYAGSIIHILGTPIAEPSSKQKLERQALNDAAVFHLRMALHFYLRELAESRHIKNLSAIHSIGDLVNALRQTDSASSESSELLSLSETVDTWLNQLLCYYNQLSLSPERSKEKKAFGKENLIELIELTDIGNPPHIQLTPEILSSWLNSFRILVARQRETSAEY